MTAPPPETAADLLVASLVGHGVERVFCVPGESFLPVLDRLADAGIDLVTCRHEGGAAFMAIADAKITGRAGVVLVNRGPGATNAAIAVHSADLDTTPILLIVGDVRTPDRGRRAFQELDHHATFASMSRGVWTVSHPRLTGEFTARALAAAHGATPGPAVLVVPEDVLLQLAEGTARTATVVQTGAPPPGAVDTTTRLLAGAARPVLIAGGQLSTPLGRQALRAVAHRHRLPVLVTNKNQDLFDNTDDLYAGHLHLATQPRQRELLAGADLFLAVGTRLDPVTTQQFTLPSGPDPGRPLVHVHPDPSVLGTAYQTRHAFACSPVSFLRELATAMSDGERDDGWRRQIVGYDEAQSRWDGRQATDGVVFGRVVATLRDLTQGTATITIDAGNFTSWVHRYYRVSGEGRMLGIASSAMGFGVPAGVAAALHRPSHPVVTFVGDGGFLMTGSELATAVRYQAQVVLIVADNGSYATIRQHQERAYPGRNAGTDLTNPDFAALGRAYGALGLTVGCDDDVEPALAKALAHPGPSVVHVHTSLQHISAYRHLAGIGRNG